MDATEIDQGREIESQLTPYRDGYGSTASLFVLDGQELARLTVVNATAGLTVQAQLRVLTPKGRIQHTRLEITPASNRTAVTISRALGDGVLVGGTIRVTAGSPLFGFTAVVLDLIQGLAGEQQSFLCLGAGYITANAPIILPSVAPAVFVDGPGAVRSITGSTPAAGAEINEVVPTGARWELLAFRFVTTWSATVANRTVTLNIDDGANVYYTGAANDVSTAGQVLTWQAAAGLSRTAPPVALNVVLPLYTGAKMLAGHRMRTLTGALQAGDQYSAPQYLVREWQEVN